jgi:hypothetical protein
MMKINITMIWLLAAGGLSLHGGISASPAFGTRPLALAYLYPPQQAPLPSALPPPQAPLTSALPPAQAPLPSLQPPPLPSLLPM